MINLENKLEDDSHCFGGSFSYNDNYLLVTRDTKVVLLVFIALQDNKFVMIDF